MSTTLKKPGYMFRACLVWVILNTILLLTLGSVVWVLSNYASQFLGTWYVLGVLLVAVTASEWIIMAETIAPIMKEWITQEECIADGKDPSWIKPVQKSS